MNSLKLAVLFLAAPALGSSLFQHELERVPKGTLECESLKEQLASDFTAASGVQLYSASVENEGEASCDIQFAYVAEKRIAYVRTVDDHDFSSEPYQAAYATRELCEQKLAWEQSQLEEQTGLSPWIAYCHLEDRFLSDLRYTPVVEAFGESEKRLYKSSTSVWVHPLPDWKSFGEDFVNEIQYTKSAKFVTAAYDRGPMAGDRELVTRYYAGQRHWLRSLGFATHSDPEVCFAQLERVRASLRSGTYPPLLAYCGKRLGKKFELGLILLEDDILSGSQIKASEDTKRFETLEDCLASVEQTEEFYRTTLQRPVLSGFCGGQDFFRITLFEERIKKP